MTGRAPLQIALQGPSHPFPGGMSSYTENLAAALARRADVEAIRWATWKTPFPRALHRGGADLPSMVPRDPKIAIRPLLHYAWPPSWRRAADFLAQADVLHIQANAQLHLFAQNRIARRQRGLPLVTTLHNLRPHDRQEPHLKPLVRWLVRRSDEVIVHNEALKAALQRSHRVPAERIVVAGHPLYEGLSRGRWDQAQARRELGLPPSAPVFLFLGAIRAYKGLGDLLEAMAKVPQAHLVVAGKVWQGEADLQALAASKTLRGRVHLRLGYVPDDRLELFFNAVDAVVFPFRSIQGESGSVKLAQSFGKPVIVTDALAPMPDAWAQVAVRDLPGSLADALSRFTQTGDRRASASQAITWEQMAARCVESYRRVMDARRRSSL
jgi:D-inositol-3-phosphate glycosyltransferase